MRNYANPGGDESGMYFFLSRLPFFLITTTLTTGLWLRWLSGGKPVSGAGTVGSVVGTLVLVWGALHGWWDFATILWLAVAGFFLGWASMRPGEEATLWLYKEFYDHRGNLVDRDAIETVIDETVAIPLAALTIYIPQWFAQLTTGQEVILLLSSLVLFRVFDIIKPFGIGKIDELKNTFVIMFDDTMAAFYAALVNTLCVVAFVEAGWLSGVVVTSAICIAALLYLLTWQSAQRKARQLSGA